MTQKMNVTKPGFDVLTETDPDNITFSSDYSTLKYDVSGTIAVNYTQGTGGFTQWDASVPHNLPYKPFFMAFVDTQNSGTYVIAPYRQRVLTRLEDFHCYADGTNIGFTVGQYSAGGVGTARTAVFRYFIFRNNLGF